MSIQPEGEDLRKAIQWISEERLENPDVPLQSLVEKACIKFDLSPMDAMFLERHVQKSFKG
jgi:CRISPR/Cas system CMR-associated protein Cmr5 small subunit